MELEVELDVEDGLLEDVFGLDSFLSLLVVSISAIRYCNSYQCCIILYWIDSLKGRLGEVHSSHLLVSITNSTRYIMGGAAILLGSK